MHRQSKISHTDIEGELLSPSRNDAFDIQEANPIVYMADSDDPDTMYLHEVKREKGWNKFKKEIELEINSHLDNNNFELVKKSSVPKDIPILPSVWEFRWKRKISTGQVYKWKAHLNLDWSKQVAGIHFDESFISVASWPTIRTMMATTITNNWNTVHIEFMQSFPQAPIE